MQKTKVIFNPKDEGHRKIAEKYIKTAFKGNASWGKDGCPFRKTEKFQSVDVEVRTKLLAHYIRAKYV